MKVDQNHARLARTLQYLQKLATHVFYSWYWSIPANTAVPPPKQAFSFALEHLSTLQGFEMAPASFLMSWTYMLAAYDPSEGGLSPLVHCLQVFKEADRVELSQALLHTNCAAMLDMAGSEILQFLSSPSHRLPDLSTIARWSHIFQASMGALAHVLLVISWNLLANAVHSNRMPHC